MSFGTFGHPGHGAFGDESVNESAGLNSGERSAGDFALFLNAFVEGEGSGGLERFESHGGRGLIAANLLCEFTRGCDGGGIGGDGAVAGAGNRTRCGDFLRVGDGGGKQVAVGEAIEQSEFERGGSFHDLTRDDELGGFRESDEAGQALRATGAGDDAEIGFGKADLRVLRGDAVVAGHGEFEAAAERHAVNRDDDGLGGILKRGEKGREIGAAAFARRDGSGEFVDVRARDESLAAADEHDGGGVGIQRGAEQRLGETFGHAGTEGVDGRIVDRDNGHGAMVG